MIVTASELKRLLGPDGSIWVHLDDAEVHRLRCVMDEVFGSELRSTVVWQKIDARTTRRSTSLPITISCSCTRRSAALAGHRLDRTDLANKEFWNPDNDQRGSWRRSDLTASKPYSDGHEGDRPDGEVFTPRV